MVQTLDPLHFQVLKHNDLWERTEAVVDKEKWVGLGKKTRYRRGNIQHATEKKPAVGIFWCNPQKPSYIFSSTQS